MAITLTFWRIPRQALKGGPSGDRKRAKGRFCRSSAAVAIVLAVCIAFIGMSCGEGLSAELRSGKYVVIHSGKSDRTARFVIADTIKAIGELESEFGGEFGLPVRIILLEREKGGGPPAPDGLPKWFAGAAIPSEGTIYLKTSSAIRWGTADLSGTLKHELTHLYLRVRVKGGFLPRWLEEGLAMREAGEYGLTHRLSLSAVSVRGNLPFFSHLEYSFPKDEEEARLAYASSFKFVGHLLQEGGEGRMKELLDMVADGHDFHDAFRKLYGRGLEEVEAQWRTTLKRHYRWISAVAAGSTIWSLMALLFLGVYVWKKISSQRKLASMDEEEWG